jgi:hypothetical protein
MCKREGLTKKGFVNKEGQGKGRAKKKKGRAAAPCNECKAAGGNCVKLSPAGFVLEGISADHAKAFINGIYSKTEKIVNGRHVYEGPNGVSAWHSIGSWLFGEEEDTGGTVAFADAQSLAASPASISNDSEWAELINDVRMRGITTTALTDEALAAAKIAANIAFDKAIEQAAPSFVLTGLDSDPNVAVIMGVYERQDEREKVNGRFIYKGPDGAWAWSGDNGRQWCVGFGEEGIGADAGVAGVASPAPTPENIKTKVWGVADGSRDCGWRSAQLKTTAIYHKPAELFKGTCTQCVYCRQRRRCGKFIGCSNVMYCCEECQGAPS